jgi:hypothetical protein
MPDEFVAPSQACGGAPRPSAIPRENIALSSRLVGDRGAEPSELRVQLPIKVINLKTAKGARAHGAARFASADEVIE